MKYIAAAIFLFAFFLPLNTSTSNLFLILLLGASVVYLYRNNLFRFVGARWKMLVYSMAPFFFLHVMGMFYTDFPENGYVFIERRISYLLVPVIFLFYNRQHLKKMEDAFLKGLLYGSVISILVLLAIHLHAYFSNRETLSIGTDLFDYYHTSNNFTKPLDIHPTYQGMYYLASLIFLYRFAKRRISRITLMLLFGTAIIFLNSRIIFLGVLIWALYFLYRKVFDLLRKQNYIQIVAFGLFICLGLLLSFKLISETYIGFRLKNIYQFEFSMETEKNFNYYGKSNPRMARYVSALKLIKKKPVFGHGVANETSSLKIQFIQDGLFYAAEGNYNAHNQFLGYAIRFGILGVLSLLFFFVLNSWLATRVGDYEFLLFLAVVLFANLVENYFDRNFGITFSVILFTVLSYKHLHNLETNQVDI